MLYYEESKAKVFVGVPSAHDSILMVCCWGRGFGVLGFQRPRFVK